MPSSGTWAITPMQDSMGKTKIGRANFFMMSGDVYLN
jgi:hypothetical protein